MRNQVFICYSHNDDYWHERLSVHMKSLSADTQIAVWDDTQIPSGANWRDAIQLALSKAKVGVVLVSPDLLASDFVRQTELPTLLRAAETEGATIISVIVMPSRFKKSPLEQFQAQNSPDQPLQKLLEDGKGNEAEKILVDLTTRIEEILRNP